MELLIEKKEEKEVEPTLTFLIGDFTMPYNQTVLSAVESKLLTIAFYNNVVNFRDQLLEV